VSVAIVMGTTDRILPDDLPEAVLEFDSEPAESTSNFHDKVLHAKKEMIVEAMKQSKGNYTAAAKMLGLHPNYLHRLIRNLNLKDELRP
jgi:two-component system, NtrC family, response regulator HydG